MKLLFITLFFVSLLNIQAQTIQEADLSIPITVKENPGSQSTVFFGIDSVATDSIDHHLGEANIPPDGCGWGFCATFFFQKIILVDICHHSKILDLEKYLLRGKLNID